MNNYNPDNEKKQIALGKGIPGGLSLDEANRFVFSREERIYRTLSLGLSYIDYGNLEPRVLVDVKVSPAEGYRFDDPKSVADIVRSIFHGDVYDNRGMACPDQLEETDEGYTVFIARGEDLLEVSINYAGIYTNELRGNGQKGISLMPESDDLSKIATRLAVELKKHVKPAGE